MAVVCDLLRDFMRDIVRSCETNMRIRGVVARAVELENHVKQRRARTWMGDRTTVKCSR